MMRNMLILLLAVFSAATLAQEQGNGNGRRMPQMEQMQQMQGRMQAMQEQMARIHETEDPAERQRLMQEHMESMHQGMMTMGQMMQRGMAGNAMAPCDDGDTQCQMNRMQMSQRMMAQQMGMMHQMMEQMMQRLELSTEQD